MQDVAPRSVVSASRYPRGNLGGYRPLSATLTPAGPSARVLRLSAGCVFGLRNSTCVSGIFDEQVDAPHPLVLGGSAGVKPRRRRPSHGRSRFADKAVNTEPCQAGASELAVGRGPGGGSGRDGLGGAPQVDVALRLLSKNVNLEPADVRCGTATQVLPVCATAATRRMLDPTGGIPGLAAGGLGKGRRSLGSWGGLLDEPSDILTRWWRYRCCKKRGFVTGGAARTDAKSLVSPSPRIPRPSRSAGRLVAISRRPRGRTFRRRRSKGRRDRRGFFLQEVPTYISLRRPSSASSRVA